MYLTPVGVQFTEQLQKVALKGLIILHGDRHFKYRTYPAKVRFAHAASFSDMAVLRLAFISQLPLKQQTAQKLFNHSWIRFTE